MNCTSCGTQLPPGARACAYCGALTPDYYSNPSPPSYSSPPGVPPVVGVPYSAPPQRPSTGYGSGPYGTPASTPPYSTPTSPYGVPAPGTYQPPVPPSPPPSRPPASPRRNAMLGIIIGAVLLVLILIGAGILVIAGSKGTSATPTPTPRVAPTPTPTPTPIPATATAMALQNIYTQATSSTPAINDPLQSPDNFGWDQSSDKNASCGFAGGAYHASAKPDYFSPCYAESTNFSNLALQVEITILSGHSGGLLLRNNSNSFAGYQFRISTDGTYILNKNVPNTDGSANFTTIISGHSSAITTGNNQPNLLAVVARGDKIYLYVNKQYIDSATDTSFTSGQVGVYVDSDANSVEATFSNFQVWKL